MEQGWQKYPVKKGQKEVSFGPNVIILTDKKEKKYTRVESFSSIEIKDPTWRTGHSIKIIKDCFEVKFTEPAPSDEDYFYFRILDIEGNTRFVDIGFKLRPQTLGLRPPLLLLYSHLLFYYTPTQRIKLSVSAIYHV